MGFQDWTVAQIKSLRDTVKKLIDGSKSISELDEKQDVLKGDYVPVYSTEEKETNKYDLSKLLFLINGFQKSDEIDKPNGYVGLNSQSKINPDFLPEFSGYRIKPVAGTKKYQLLKGKEVISEIDLTPYWNHINNSLIHVTPEQKEDWGEKYSLDFVSAEDKARLFKGDNQVSEIDLSIYRTPKQVYFKKLPWEKLQNVNESTAIQLIPSAFLYKIDTDLNSTSFKDNAGAIQYTCAIKGVKLKKGDRIKFGYRDQSNEGNFTGRYTSIADFTLAKDENSLVEFFEFTFVKFYRKPFQGTGLVYENYTQLEFFIKPTKNTNGLENQDLGGLYGLGRLEIELITSSVLGERQIQFTNQFALHFNS